MAASSTGKNARPLILRYLILLAIDTVVVFTLSFIIQALGGSNQVSNFYFLSALVFFIVAAIPIFSEMGGSIRVAGKVLKGEEAEELVTKHKEKSQSGIKTTYLYGLLGITTFILALVLV